MLLKVFQDTVIRIFSKDSNFQVQNELFSKYCEWATKKGISKPIFGQSEPAYDQSGGESSD